MAVSIKAHAGAPPSSRWLPADCPDPRFFILSRCWSSLAADCPYCWGIEARIGALVLLLFLIPVTVIYHPFWKRSGADVVVEADHFLSNLAIMDGLLVIVALGSGRISVIDHSLAQLVEYMAAVLGMAR
jgi:hypothetical protein